MANGLANAAGRSFQGRHGTAALSDEWADRYVTATGGDAATAVIWLPVRRLTAQVSGLIGQERGTSKCVSLPIRTERLCVPIT